MAIRSLGKDSGTRSDFDDEFDKTIRQKGFRAYWSRAILCPCRLNGATKHADPSCVNCGGDGWFYVLPAEADSLDFFVNEGFNDLANAKATKCLVTSVAKNMEIYEHLGEWIFGDVNVTCLSFHKFSYRDRFTLVDGRSEYQQVIKVPASRSIPVKRRDPENNLRYPALSVLHAITVDAQGVRTEHKDSITIESDGSLTLDPTLPTNYDLVTVVYEYHPVLIIMQNVIDTRLSPRKFKSKNEEVLFLPRFSRAKPDYFPDEPTGTPGQDFTPS